MATPMRHAPSQQGRTPSQMAGAAPTPPVSTPFSNSLAAFSPSQGSKTSPQAFKKSPAASHHLKNASDGPGAVNFDSPSATAALGALGIHDLSLDNISVGGMGMGRSDEDDRKRRMNAIVAMIKAGGTGRVSNEGLERLARSIGLECLWEDNIAGGPKSKTLFIAGTGLTLEIIITNHVVENVQLMYPEGCAPSVQEHVGRAADVLLSDLKLQPGEWALTKTLERFSPNLERIAAPDRLSVLPTLNCYDAIDGIYQSLLKIFNWDVTKLKDDPKMQGRSEDYVKVAALCTRHGCPQMHVRGRIGLSLDYWKEWRRLHKTTIETTEEEGPKTWSLMIECAPKNNLAYMPIRVSHQWVSDNIEKAATAEDMMLSNGGPILDWQEPENILVPAGAGEKPEGSIGPDPGLPDVIFMAVFDPPLIVSSGVAAQIYSIAGIQQPGVSSSTFDALVFPIPQGVAYDPTESRIITHTQPIMLSTAAKSGTRKIRLHRNTLNTDRAVYGELLTRVPFQHPRQLLEMLPVLRQYAFLSSLLNNSFKKNEHPDVKPENIVSKETTTANDEFAAFMKGSDKPPEQGSTTLDPFPVDVALTAHPVPRLRVVFPFKGRTANITLEIQLGGKVHIISDNIFNSDVEGVQKGDDPSSWNGPGNRYNAEQYAEMLEMTDHIGKWVERIKYKFNDQ
ncbi:mediator of RNA polymerase II transcription subunit 1-domain-containing protein [Pestalotiopsis sp. NC0098]|nr:mediator of RNA polymerase II transcription subunit 1-domain-containing protein [Pestalotiopsis sp. NC0098]